MAAIITNDTTLFDGVITNENSFTELFKNFLRYKIFRKSLLDLIEFSFDKQNVDYDSFDTQFTIAKFGRPDLVLTTDETEILFEIKVHDTALTSNQPLAYYNYLKTKSIAKHKALILIAPNNYYDMRKYNELLNGLKVHGDNIHTQEIHWNTITNIITDSELETVSLLFQEYSTFLKNWFHMTFIFFDSLNTTTMFGKEFPESLHKTCSIIDNAFNEFKKRGYSIKRTNDKYFTEYGFEFNLPNEEALFFGIWFDYWQESGNPVCICLASDDANQVLIFKSAIEINNLNPASEFDEYPVTFIDKSKLMDKKCEQIITNILTDFATKLNALTVAHSEAETIQEEE